MLNHDQVTAVILAGGMARRMGGVDKGWMELNGKPLIRHVLDKVQPQVHSCLINANRSLDAYGTLSLPVVCDLEGDFQGPLMGIATGLFHANTDWVLFFPCDSPYLPDDLVERMLVQAKDGAEIVVAHDGNRIQPVVSLIKRELLDSLQATLAEGERKIDRWYAIHNMVTADFSDHKEAFINVNRRDDLAELQQMPKLLGFAAWSGTGKTTLLKQLIPMLKEQGVRVGVIKHAHHKFDVDHPGKDSYELRKAGADQMLISSGKRWALMVEEDQGDRPSLMHMISRLDHSLLDLVLVEGFKQDPFPKIELHRTVMNRELMHGEDENIIAFATDEPVSMQRDIPVLDINNPQAILSFIQNYLNADND
jgi:molybdopterin-guanine dinucleotide biosynthesis protein A